MSLRLRPGLLISTLISFGILCSLGIWQLQRLEWKRDLIAQIAERLSSAPIPFDDAVARDAAGENMDYQPVVQSGVYLHDLESFVFGTYEGRAGVYVFTPLEAPEPASGGRRYIYTNRGFAPQDLIDSATRADAAVAGEVRVEGLLRRAEVKRGFEKWLAPKDQPADKLYFVRDPGVFAARRAGRRRRLLHRQSGARERGRLAERRSHPHRYPEPSSGICPDLVRPRRSPARRIFRLFPQTRLTPERAGEADSHSVASVLPSKCWQTTLKSKVTPETPRATQLWRKR